MKHIFFLIVLSFLSLSTSLHAQTVITANNQTLSASGSYRLGNNVTQLTISGSHIALDMNGFAVLGPFLGNCTITVGTAGNSCTSAPVGGVALSISGTDITVKNGFVWQGKADGISVTSSLSSNANILIEDVSVSNFWGNGIVISNGATLINVQVNQVGGYGILGGIDTAMHNVTADYNNNTGIQLTSGNLDGIKTNYNKGAGLFSAGSITRATSTNNLSQGIIGTGNVRDSYALGNGGDGFYVTAGTVTNSTSNSNGGHGFNFTSTSACYWGLSASGNTGTNFTGGTALASGVATCS